MRIVEESNTYATQADISKPLYLAYEELEKFNGILISMTIVKMPGTCDFWERFLQCDRIEFSMKIRVHQMISSL